MMANRDCRPDARIRWRLPKLGTFATIRRPITRGPSGSAGREFEEGLSRENTVSAGELQKPSEEQVLVVPRACLFPEPEQTFSGFETNASPFLEIAEREAFLVPRPEAETQPDWKQLIPYGVVLCGEDVFLMRRRKGGGEARLHDLYSLGVGGHVNEGDLPPNSSGKPHGAATGKVAAVERAFRREVNEELHIDEPWSSKLIGALNDDSNSVGKVHLGLIYRIELKAPVVKVREHEALEGSWVNARTLGDFHSRMETWSQILTAAATHWLEQDALPSTQVPGSAESGPR